MELIGSWRELDSEAGASGLMAEESDIYTLPENVLEKTVRRISVRGRRDK